MKFKSPTTALEWYVGHRLGSNTYINDHDAVHRSYDGAMVAAADIELMLGRLSFPVQKTLIDFTLNDAESIHTSLRDPFFAKTMIVFGDMLGNAGYLKEIDPPGQYLIAA